MKTFEQFVNGEYELKYEKWPWEGYSEGHDSWVLYKDGKAIAGMSNDNDDKNNVSIRKIESHTDEKGIATKLLFMLLDQGVVVTTGKPNYNSTTEKGYYWKKSVVEKIKNSAGKYEYEIIGKSVSRDDDPSFINIKDKDDNYHYTFRKK